MGAPTQFAIGLILCAAVLHAVWNALVKGSADRVITLGLINLGHGLVGAVMVVLYLPPARESWPFIAASTFIHYFYYGFLLVAYRYGDLSQVYPIARGVAPVLVALGAQFFASEVLPPVAWAGILIISVAIGAQTFGRRGASISTSALAAAVLTGITIASYSVADGMGVRVSASPLGYIGWLFALEAVSTAVLLGMRWDNLRDYPLKNYLIGIGGGLISALAYGLAIYATSLTSLGTVSAIRESSVIIAALIGVVWFGERPWKLRMISVVFVVIGIVLLATA
jgi:drug/metabolite transporter (DMT)-like permease